MRAGGVEIFTDDLVDELRRRGHDADLVSVPFKWYPGERVLTQAFMWRLLDLEEADGQRIDLVIATKFPSYVVRHPNKVVWLVHQFRQAYELDRTALGQFGESPEERAIRRKVQQLDTVALGEARKVFATSRNVADRLDRSTGIAAEVMPHPPQELAFRCDEYGDFVLSVGRLDRAKRIDLLIEAAKSSGTKVVIAETARTGSGSSRSRTAPCRFAGRVSEEELADLYAALPRRLLRAGGRGLRDGPVRGVPRREAGRDDDRRRRAARGRHRPRHRARHRAARRGARRAPSAP